jgi:predicted O-methyltransferase YrrM
MSADLWSSVDDYICEKLIGADAALDQALAASRAAGLPDIAVSPAQGKQLHLLARMQRAERILEIGALGGYSAIWLARALPPTGRLITLEVEPRHAEVARANLARAGLASLVDVRVGKALDLLPALAAEGAGPFDLTFIDADKENIPAYFRWAVDLSREGGVIIVDNVVRKGALIDAASKDPAVQGVRALHDLVASEPRVSATTIQTVGAKGHDGFLLAVVIA